MTKRMLIDATHAEETRVVVLDGNRLEDFDVETSTKRQLKGNIYLAKVIRVEPSLQAAFVEYGGGRHGFLAFGEIHPDYYQIPVADRQRLLEMQAQEAREEEEAEEAAERAHAAGGRRQHQNGHGPQSQARNGHDHGEALEPEPVQPDEPQSDGPQFDEPQIDAPPSDEAQSGVATADGLSGDETTDFSSPEPDSVPPAADLAHQEPDAEPDRHEHGTREDDVHEHGADEHVAHEHRADEHGPDEHKAHDHPSSTDQDHGPGIPAQAAAMDADVRYGEEFSPHQGESVHVHGAGALTGEPAHEDHPGEDHPGEDRSGEDRAEGGHSHDGHAHDQSDQNHSETGHHDEAGYSETAGDEGHAAIEAPPADETPPETIGGETDTFDGAAEARARRTSRLLRNYRIQEVIRRRQIMLIQVVKEERGTKGAALTTYISLAGRFCVLMPNSPRGGGISRKITSAADRRRLKEITTELEIPRGMGLIVRTAGAARPKPEITRDCEYLMRLWDDIREHTMKSVAPALIYEEASLIKRAIRDVYSRDVDEVLVDGEAGWKAAHDFMRMLMPSHARKVQLWRSGDSGQSLFSKQSVEAQLDGMLSPTVQLKSGGYLVIAQTEALVSIDVNSGRSTRERGIEETALKTNLEAADEVARQLKLRDLAGLIVIDFIDMDARKHNAMVERRMKDALKNDRARIQVGTISHFGLMEMSRQRLRPSLAETSFVTCMHCNGAGLVRSVESSAIHALRDIEDEGAKRRASLIMVHCASAIALYLLNNKRDRLGEIEARFAMRVHFTPDDTLVPPSLRIDRLKPPLTAEEMPLARPVIPMAPVTGLAIGADEDLVFAPEAEDFTGDEDDDSDVEYSRPASSRISPPKQAASAPAAARPAVSGEADSPAAAVASGEDAGRRRRRRRRRPGRRDGVEGGELGASAGAGGEAIAGGEQADGELPFGDEAPFPDGGEGSSQGDEFSSAIAAGAGQASPSEAADMAETPVAEMPIAVAAMGEDGQPLVDHDNFDENGLPKSRGPRRGRRGGRRRRREEGEAGAGGTVIPIEAGAPGAPMHEEAVYEAPRYEAPRYTGPTPADPFGSQPYDIFDMMDPDHPINAGRQAAVSPAGPASTGPLFGHEPPIEIPPVPANATAPTEVEPHVEPSLTATEAPAAEVVHAEIAAAEPAHDPAPVESAPVAHEPVQHEPAGHESAGHDGGEPELARADSGAVEQERPEPPPASPAIKPIVIGSADAPTGERKGGWWKR